jgi:hypothetical protein
VDALEQVRQHGCDVVRGDRGDETHGATGVGDVGPARQQLSTEDVADGGDGTDSDVGADI